MKTRLLIIIGFVFALGFIGTVYATPELDRERSYERADFVFYGEVLSLEVLSESTQTIKNDNNVYSAGKVIYSIKIYNFIKNSFDDKVISAYGFYYLEKPYETSQSLYKIGDKIKFYINIFNENESSYEYLIDYAEIDTKFCGEGTAYANGVCLIIKSEEPTRMEPSIFLDGFMFLLVISPFFIPGAIIFIVLSKTPRYIRGIIITVCIPATIMILYFLLGLIVGWYPPGYA